MTRHTSKEQQALIDALSVWRDVYAARLAFRRHPWRVPGSAMHCAYQVMLGSYKGDMYMRHTDALGEFSRYERSTRDTEPAPVYSSAVAYVNTGRPWMFLN